MRISDWSSEVCSSDLENGFDDFAHRPASPSSALAGSGSVRFASPTTGAGRDMAILAAQCATIAGRAQHPAPEDRKRGVSGQSVSVRVARGGRRHIKKQHSENLRKLPLPYSPSK